MLYLITIPRSERIGLTVVKKKKLFHRGISPYTAPKSVEMDGEANSHAGPPISRSLAPPKLATHAGDIIPGFHKRHDAKPRYMTFL